jgi:hypothetical protein
MTCSLKLGNLIDVVTLGIGLYLALGIIQALSSGGLSGLRRRSEMLSSAARQAKIVSEYEPTRRLKLDISGLEIGFESLNRTILWLVSSLFFIGLAGFVYCVIEQNEWAGAGRTAAILSYYIGLPVVIFIVSGLLIRKRCHEVRGKIQAAEARIQKQLLGV